MTFRISLHLIINMIAIGATLTLFTSLRASAQQVPDLEFQYQVESPAYSEGMGPRLLIDREHSPYIKRGSYDPFLRLVQDDGFQAGYMDAKISEKSLSNVQILVVVNSYRRDFADFSLLQPPSAYELDEIVAIRDWVKSGGRLFLVADHAPFAGGTSALAEALGFTFFNGYVFEKASIIYQNGHFDFRPDHGLNLQNPVISGNFIQSNINRFYTFTGTAFIAPPKATQLLTIPQGYVAMMTQNLRREAETAPLIDVSGFSQGATLKLGKGRVAVFAEAASFTAQIVNKIKPMGMNDPRAKQNPQFLLATMRWLAEGL